MASVTAIVLAAGLSRRMGSDNKLLLPIAGKRIVAHVIDQVARSQCHELIVVTSHLTHDALEGGYQRAVNANAEQGMTSSIQTGIRASKKDTDGFMICLGDQPLIQSHTYDQLISQFKTDSIIVPYHQGQRGNPAIFPSGLKQAILECQDPEGCKSVIAAHRHQVIKVEVDTPSILQDIDTPEDYRLLSGK